jgi:hypothetical protein
MIPVIGWSLLFFIVTYGILTLTDESLPFGKRLFWGLLVAVAVGLIIW